MPAPSQSEKKTTNNTTAPKNPGAGKPHTRRPPATATNTAATVNSVRCMNCSLEHCADGEPEARSHAVLSDASRARAPRGVVAVAGASAEREVELAKQE